MENKWKGPALFLAVGRDGQEIRMKYGLKLQTIRPSYEDLERRFQYSLQPCASVPLLKHKFINSRHRMRRGSPALYREEMGGE